MVNFLLSCFFQLCTKWSGGLTMAFALGSWYQIRLVTAKNTNKTTKSGASKSQRRLLRIAGMVSTCLLLNGIANLSTAAKLKEWSRTADISLACSIKENWNTRNWDMYGFTKNEVANVCSQESAIEVMYPCVSDCFWHPDITDSALTCHPGGGEFESLDERATYYREQREAGLWEGPGQFNPCDCDCGQLIQIERPRFRSASPLSLFSKHLLMLAHFLHISVAILSLAHLSQSLVVVTVGLNLGFR
jgi:hypothetical protein